MRKRKKTEVEINESVHGTFEIKLVSFAVVELTLIWFKKARTFFTSN